MRSGQENIVATVLLLSIVVISSLSAYSVFQSLQSEIQTSSSSSIQQINQLPPNIESTYTRPPTPTKKTTTLCSVIRNPNDYNIQLSNITLYLYKDNTLILTETNTFNDCNNVVPPKGICKVCADVIIPEEGTYTYKFVYGSAPISSQTLKVPKEHVSLYPDLVVKSISAYQDHYSSNTLLFGDYNSFTVKITVCNDGRDDMNTTATLTLSADNATFSQTTFTVPVLSPSECNTFTTAGTTENYYDVRITARIDYPDIELTTRNNVLSRTFTNAYYDECNSCESCTVALNTAAERSRGTFYTFVVLAADLRSSSTCIRYSTSDDIFTPSGAIKTVTGITGSGEAFPVATFSTVTLDGNAHAINIEHNGSAVTYGILLAGVDGIHIKNLVVSTKDRYAIYLYSSSASLHDVNASANNSYAIYLDSSSASLQDVNASANNSYAITLYSSSASLHDVNASANYDAIHLYSSFASLHDVNASANNSYAITLYSSSASLHDVNASANYDAIHLWNSYISSSTNSYCYLSGNPTPYPILSFGPESAGKTINLNGEHYCHISIHDVNNLSVTNANVGSASLVDYGGVVLYNAHDVNIQDVNASANYDAIHLYSSSASLQDVNASANSDAIFSYCGGGTNELNVDLSTADSRICASGTIWYVAGGDLNVNCLNCGNGHYLHTDFSSRSGGGALNVGSSCYSCNQPC